jgi:threonine dehydratase
MREALQRTHNLVEGAGAASLAAARRFGPTLAGRKVVCVMSGGNVDLRTLADILPENSGSTTQDPPYTAL